VDTLWNHGAWVGPFLAAVGMFGTVVFAVSGALAAGRYRMDPIGFMFLGTATAIGGGTMRSLLMDQPVLWVQSPGLLGVTIGASLVTYFFLPGRTARWRAMIWFDALGLAAFSVTGAEAALAVGASWPIAIAMAVISSVGGGVIRDLLANQRPVVMRGELYASAVLLGAGTYVAARALGAPVPGAMLIGFAVTLALRSAAIVLGLELGAPGEWWRHSRSPAEGEAVGVVAGATADNRNAGGRPEGSVRR
jgi:uncharacterized membrane protein YeiH